MYSYSREMRGSCERSVVIRVPASRRRWLQYRTMEFYNADRHAIMDTNGNGHNSITSSTPILSEGKANLLKQQQPQQHGSGSTRLNVIVKPNNGLRKMSTMPEEEDGTDELDSDVIKTPLPPQQQHQHDVDSDSTYEERGRLLSSASNKKITITPSSTVSNVSREACCNGVKRPGSGHNSSTDSVQEKILPRSYQQQSEFRLIPYRDTGCVQQLPGSGRTTRALELQGGGGGGGRHHRYPSMRSLKSNATVDENNYYLQQMNHQHHPHHHHQLNPCHHYNCQNQNHPPATSWTSFVFTDGQGPPSMVRTIPSSVSIRSLASIGMGSSDGRKLTIRRVPTSPSELLNMMHPPTPIEDDISTYTSFDDCDADDPGDYRQPRRPHWANKSQFVLACISYSIGLGNVWRFPYLCYQSGGGVFLVPYFLILIVCGVPLLYMELSIGQFTRRGPIGALGQLCPLLKGAGLSSVVISFLMSTYHNMIIAYAIYYLFASFRSDIPWADCDNSWNSPECWIPSDKIIDNRTRPNNSITPSEDFFNNKVLRISRGIEDPGILRWDLVACLMSAWVLVYFSIWKSIKSSAQVRYLTATLPFVLIVVFLMRSLTLEGADKGLQFFFHPRWELLGDAKVWVNAAAQIFTSVGIAFGSMICFASYNKFHNTILVDTVAVSLINAFSCLLVGIFSFATIGNIAKEHNTSVEAVLSDGPGLVFVLYPQALVKMPASQLWGILFFFMLVCLSLNSQFAIVEVVVTSIQDGFPNWVKRNLLCHEVLVFLVCAVSFVCGLPNTTQGGIYFFQLIDHYAASLSIMFLAFFEVIAVSWFYGVGRLCSNVKEMTGRVPSTYMRFCWKIAAPAMILAVWVFSLIDYEPPTFHNGEYEYPGWAEALGWGLASLSLICIPAFAIYVLFKAEGQTFMEKFRNSIKPYFEACKICGQEYCTEPIHNFEEDMLKDTQEMPSSPLHANYLLTSKPPP